MKKIFLLIAVIVLNSCTRDVDIYSMKPPIVVVGKSDEAIVLHDQNNNWCVYNNENYYGKALINSYKIGDTLR